MSTVAGTNFLCQCLPQLIDATVVSNESMQKQLSQLSWHPSPQHSAGKHNEYLSATFSAPPWSLTTPAWQKCGYAS